MKDSMEMSALMAKLVDAEWEMFVATQNVGGPAGCQRQPDTFRIMRSSQWVVTTPGIVQSRLDDYEQARREERNLVTEKYARMMESTFPDEYHNLEHLLPRVEERARELTEKMLEIFIPWEEEKRSLYPALGAASRPLRTAEDGLYGTSTETYFRGELLTCSVRTLELYLAHLESCRAQGRNLSLETLQYTVEQYGYPSMEVAEAYKQRGESGVLDAIENGTWEPEIAQ